MELHPKYIPISTMEKPKKLKKPTFKISNSFLFLEGSSTHSTICLTFAQGWFFSPITMRTGSWTSRAASSSVPAGIVADTSSVWRSSGTCSKISSTCCWKPIFNMVSTYKIYHTPKWTFQCICCEWFLKYSCTIEMHWWKTFHIKSSLWYLVNDHHLHFVQLHCLLL